MRSLGTPKVKVRRTITKAVAGGSISTRYQAPRVRPTDPGGVKHLTKAIEAAHAVRNGYKGY